VLVGFGAVVEVGDETGVFVAVGTGLLPQSTAEPSI
jgi:hypothetical protein